MRFPSSWAWRGLHLLLTLSLPFVMVFLFGCIRAKEEKADLGPEVDPDAINTALWKIKDQSSLDGLHVGQYIDYVILRRIENSDNTMVLGSTTVAVMDAQSVPDLNATRFTMQINKSYRRNDGSFDIVSTEDRITLANPGTSAAMVNSADLRVPAALRANPPRPLDVVRDQALHTLAASDTQPRRITYHHFREGDETMPVPDKVKLKADCGGLSSCEIPMHYVRFELVAWYTDTDYQKISFDFGFSTRTPWIPFGSGFTLLTGAMVVDCRSTYVQLTDRNVYVRDCQQLEDFQK